MRKRKGAYYTPRPIVAYMCQQSLINYLDTHFANIARDDLETFIIYGERHADFEARSNKANEDKLCLMVFEQMPEKSIKGLPI
ncbi:MAG: hypothetical protein IPP63_16925 [Chloracidobacterium sp.]|nr:hypothetical protein [Chloracidobacterium sp.]